MPLGPVYFGVVRPFSRDALVPITHHIVHLRGVALTPDPLGRPWALAKTLEVLGAFCVLRGIITNTPVEAKSVSCSLEKFQPFMRI